MKKILTAIYRYFADGMRYYDGYRDGKKQYLKKLDILEADRDKYKTELYKLVAYMTDGTWKDGDNMVETIDAHQADMYLAVHRDGVIDLLMNEPDPEIAAQDLFEYFGIQDIDGKLQPKE